MRYHNWAASAVIGIIVATILVQAPFVWPALVIGAGAVAAAGVLVVRRGGRKYYAAAGTAYCLGLAAVIYTTGLFPESYAESPFAALLSLGAVSGIIVAFQVAGHQLVKRAAGRIGSEDSASKIYDAIAAVAGLITMVWTVLTAQEKAMEYGGVSIGGAAGLGLNFFGIELPIPWIIGSGVDATMVVFVGSVLIGFHLLETLHTGWRATKETAKVGAKAGQIAGSKAADTAGSVRDE